MPVMMKSRNEKKSKKRKSRFDKECVDINQRKI